MQNREMSHSVMLGIPGTCLLSNVEERKEKQKLSVAVGLTQRKRQSFGLLRKGRRTKQKQRRKVKECSMKLLEERRNNNINI